MMARRGSLLTPLRRGYRLLHSFACFLCCVAGLLCCVAGSLCCAFGRVCSLLCSCGCTLGGTLCDMFGRVTSVLAKLRAALDDMTVLHIFSETLSGVFRFFPALLHFTFGALVCVCLSAKAESARHRQHA